MADAPWRCTECGTVNEPVANACRTCGRWPSLFDLEQSAVETEEPGPATAVGVAERQPIEVEPLEPEVFDVGEPENTFDHADAAAEPAKPRWRRLGSLIVPIAVVLYIIVSALANR